MGVAGHRRFGTSALFCSSVVHRLLFYSFAIDAIVTRLLLPHNNNIHHRSQRQRLHTILQPNRLGDDDNAASLKVIMWNPTSQIYENGILPSIATNASDISHLLSMNDDGRLRIFGYGSLTWHPGNGVLSLSDGRVRQTRGYINGYQRIWCQRSADHRGTPEFNGIVCTLLSDAEINKLQQRQHCYHNTHHRRKRKMMTSNSRTEGVIYAIDGELAEQCLLELDAREKGVRCV